MEYIADLHLHSKYAGACSERLLLPAMAETAQKKGISIIATGDFTHPLWLKDIKSTLEEDGGLYRIMGGASDTRFLLGSEICTIFNDGTGTSQKLGMFSTEGHVKKIHHVLLAPDIGAVEQINESLAKYGDLSIDGRPILKITASELVEAVMAVDKRNFIFPAHLWTPWFGALGAFSGFNSVEEAYGDQARHISAIDMGLSSDPAMNWRVSKLDRYALIGTSDAHSLQKMGRKATVFELGSSPSYDSIISAIRGQKIKMTVDFYPEEGKYHYDGHRNCNISLPPAEAKKYNNLCPVCRKRLTIGVLHRVEELADREEGYRPAARPPFVHTVPLQEIIAHVKKKGVGTAYVNKAYDDLIARFGTEFDILLRVRLDELGKADQELANAIGNVRAERVRVIPGYDGVFGIVDISNTISNENKSNRQSRISDF